MEGRVTEEGGACSYQENEDGTSIDPDHDFAYLDTKIKNVLGHFQKEFEGGVSVENLGAKFGGYGSFLPTYQRSPSIWSQPKCPQQFQNHSEFRSSDNQPVEVASQDSSNTTPPSAVLLMGSGDASSNFHSLVSSRLPSQDLLVKQDSCLPSCHAAEQCPMKQGASNRPVNPPNRRVLKFRIKVSSDSMSQKNAAVYSGVGLDISPSSSLEKCPVETGDSPLQFRETLNQSPTSILQIMTSFPVSGGIFLSPLNDDFLCLTRKETSGGYSKPDLRGTQGHTALSVNESACKLVGGKVLKEYKLKLELKHGSVKKIEKGINYSLKEKIDTGTPEDKEGLSDGVKLKALATPTYDGRDSTKGTGLMYEAPKQLSKETSSDIAVEDSSELMSAQDSGNSEKQKRGNCSSGNILESKVANSHKDDSFDISNDGNAKIKNISVQFKANSDVPQPNDVPKVSAMHPSKQKSVKRIESYKQDKFNMPGKTDKSLSESNRNIKRSISKHRAAADLIEESKIHDLKSQKDSYKVRCNQRDSLGNTISKGMHKQIVLLQRPSSEKTKDSDCKAAAKEQKAPFNKSKEGQHSKKGDKKLALEGTVEEAPNDGTQFVGGVLASETTTETELKYDWVCCDSCEKWRLLPFCIKPEHLPDTWICSMQDWLPGMNHCCISEDETKRAVYASYQLPVPESQNSMHNLANGSALGVTSADIQQLDKDQHDHSVCALHNGRKKILGSKELLRSHQHESVKCRSLHDVGQCHSESYPIKKSNSQLSSVALAKEKRLHRLKVKQITGGIAKLTEGKSKREADQSVYGASKKTKTEGVSHTEKFRNSVHDGDLVKVDANSSPGLSTKTSGKNMQQHNVCFYSKDAVRKPVRRKQRDSVYISLDGHMETCKRDITVKRSKLKDSLDDQNQAVMIPSAGHHIPDGKFFAKEESVKDEFSREMNSQVSKVRRKESNTSKGDDKSNKKCRVSRMSLLGGADKPFVGVEQVKNIKKHKLLKGQGKIFPERTDSLKRDLGSREASAVATSTSSMFSSSRKSKVSFQEGKGSPIESVSSSPIRASNLDSFTPARNEILGKDDAMDGGLPLTCSPRRCSEVKQNGENNQLLSARTEKGLSDLHTESLELPEKLDYQDTNANKKIIGTAKLNVERSSENGNSHLMKGDAFICKNYVRESNDRHPLGHSYNEDKFSEQCEINGSTDESNHFTEKGFLGKCSNGNTRESRSRFEQDDGLDCKQVALHDMHGENIEAENFSNQFFEKKTDFMQIGAGVIESQIVRNPEDKQERLVLGSQSVLRLQKWGDAVLANASGDSYGSRLSKQHGYSSNENGGYPCQGHLASSGCEVSNQNAPSPLRNDSSAFPADHALKLAKNLQEYADSLKNSGFAFESNEVYFQCGLEFLHGASLLETCSSENDRHGDMTRIQLYSLTAKICESCAHEYERCQEMAAAALAYKCVEVAYMRIIYCKHSSTSRDSHELQATLQMVPHGESPSSSASDVDNLNNQAAVDKAAVSKDTNSHVAGSNVIVDQNRPNFVRLLDFTQQVNYAMEASRKSQNAFAAANGILKVSSNRHIIASVKKVIDFSFQDVEGLVRLAKGAISRAGFGDSKD